MSMATHVTSTSLFAALLKPIVLYVWLHIYQYEAIILGDVDKDFFTDGQLTMLQDFVAERGGGLLVAGMLDDLFVDTPLADILPVSLVSSNLLPQPLRGGIARGNHPTGQLFVA